MHASDLWVACVAGSSVDRLLGGFALAVVRPDFSCGSLGGGGVELSRHAARREPVALAHGFGLVSASSSGSRRWPFLSVRISGFAMTPPLLIRMSRREFSFRNV